MNQSKQGFKPTICKVNFDIISYNQKKISTCTWNGLVPLVIILGTTVRSRWRNGLRKADHRLRLWMLRRSGRIVVGDALKRAIVRLVGVIVGDSPVLAFFAHTWLNQGICENDEIQHHPPPPPLTQKIFGVYGLFRGKGSTSFVIVWLICFCRSGRWSPYELSLISSLANLTRV